MNFEPYQIALITGLSAIGGGLVGVLGAFGLEWTKYRLDNRRALRDKTLEALTEFDTASFEWTIYLQVLPAWPHPTFQEALAKAETSALRLRASLSCLLLLCSQDLLQWIRRDYKPAQDALFTAVERFAVRGAHRAEVENQLAVLRKVLAEGHDLLRDEIRRLR